MMRVPRTAMAFTSPLLLLAGCGPSDGANESMGTKQVFSLCPKSDDAKERLYEQVRGFADRQRARLHDRGAEAQRELSQIEGGTKVLANTGGNIILLTIEKPNEFRITATNLELKEKVGLSVRTWGKSNQSDLVAAFINDLEPFWTIQKVEGGVGNDPVC